MSAQRLPRMDAEMTATTSGFVQWPHDSGSDHRTCPHIYGRIRTTNSMGQAWDSCAKCWALLPDDAEAKVVDERSTPDCALLPDGVVCLDGIYFKWRGGAWRLEK